MTAASPPDPPPRDDRGGSTRAVGEIAAWALAAALALAFASLRAFSYFSDYDDEGYLMISVARVLRSGRLYDDVFTQYGPFYYAARWLIHGPIGLAVSHDNARVVAVVAWTATAGMLGWLVRREAKSLALGLATFGIVLLLLAVIVKEPGHPQEFASLAIAAAMLAGRGRGPMAGLILGLAGGATLMTKPNVGVFLVAAIVAAWATARPKWWLRAPAALVAALPAAVMAANLGEGWCQRFVIVQAAALLALLAVAYRRSGPTDPPGPPIGATTLGFLVAVAASLGFAIATGTTPRGLWQGLVVQPSRFATTFFDPTPNGPEALPLAAIGLALAGLVAWRRDGRFDIAARVISVILGLAVSGWILWMNPYTPDALLADASPFLWVALVPRRGEPRPPGRALLAFAAALQVLQAYPMPASQVAFATMLIVPTALIALGEALPRSGGFRRGLVGGLLVAVLVGFGLRAAIAWNAYQIRVPLNLPGAARLRVLPIEAEVYRCLSRTLRERPGTFMTLPGWYSLYFWAKKEPPTGRNATAWMTLLDDDQQAAVVAALEQEPDLTVVRSRRLVEFWRRGQDLDDRPLVAYLNGQFAPFGRVADVELMARPGREPGPMAPCVVPLR